MILQLIAILVKIATTIAMIIFSKYEERYCYCSITVNDINNSICNIPSKSNSYSNNDNYDNVIRIIFLSNLFFKIKESFASSTSPFFPLLLSSFLDKHRKWDKVCKGRLSKFFKGFLPQNLLSPLLNTLSQILFENKW